MQIKDVSIHEWLSKKDKLHYPLKIKSPDDFKPGTKMPKMGTAPIWLVEITMPKKLMQDVEVGKENQEHNKMAELMKYSTSSPVSTDETAQEAPQNEQPAVQ